MNFWREAANSRVILLSIIVILMFATYICIKIHYKRYLFSLFNISIFTEILLIFLLPFMYEDKAWLAPGQPSAAPFYSYLNKNIEVNIIGMIVFYLVLIISEFRMFCSKSKIVSAFCKNIDVKAIGIIFFVSVIGWYTIVFIYNGTLPLINGRRDFYKDSKLSNVLYIFFSSIVPVLTSYYGLLFCRIKSRKNFFYLMIGLMTCLFSGNRSDLLTAVALPIMLVIIYKHSKNRISGTLKIIVGMTFILIVGLSLALFRSGNSANFISIIQEFIYGNTFCDMRDGAFILFGYGRMYDTYLYGKTYLAGLISFVPSFISEYKRTWGWGYFSTATLFGMPNHYGFRGGSYCEAYLNFGYIGVIISAIILGRWMAYRERLFESFLKGKVYDFEKKYLAICILSPVFSFCSYSNGLRSFYISGGTLIGASILLRVFRKNRD